MTVLVNGETRDIARGYTIINIIEELSKQKNGIAIAVNGKVIPFSNWQNYLLSDHDSVLIIEATQGG